MSPTSPNMLRPHSPSFGRKKLNLAFVEDPLLATAAANVLTPTQSQPDPDPIPQASAFVPPTIPASAGHSRYSSIASTASYATSSYEPGNPHDLRLKIPPPADSAVGDLEADRLEEIIDEQEPVKEHPYLVTHCKIYAIAEKYVPNSALPFPALSYYAVSFPLARGKHLPALCMNSSWAMPAEAQHLEVPASQSHASSQKSSPRLSIVFEAGADGGSALQGSESPILQMA